MSIKMAAGEQEIKAYFTVEAAMVLPIILGIFLLMVYGMFYQYDRCLLEQDAATIAVRGELADCEDNAERLQYLEEQAGTIDWEMYLAMESPSLSAQMKAGKVNVEVTSELNFPFATLVDYLEQDGWSLSASCSVSRRDPMTIIRLCRRIWKSGEED